jgi:hypothetical protein
MSLRERETNVIQTGGPFLDLLAMLKVENHG